MLIDIKSRLDEKEIQELIGYSVFPDPTVLEKAILEFKTNNDFKLYGYEEHGEIIGIIGFRQEENSILITHMAIKPAYRRMGYGRGLILELIVSMKPTRIIAETDEEAVEFYRNIGFVIKSLGEKYLDVERFQCIYDTETFKEI